MVLFEENDKQHHHLYPPYGRGNRYRQHGIFGPPATTVHRKDAPEKRARRIFRFLQINGNIGSDYFCLSSYTDWNRSLLSARKLYGTSRADAWIL